MRLTLALIQMNIQWHDRPANHSKAGDFISLAVQKGADVVVLPEMFSTGFSMDTDYTQESISGETPSFLRAKAVEHGIWVIAGFALQKKDGKPNNVALAVNPQGEDVALYSKIHRIALLEEDQYYDSGDLPVQFDCAGITCSCLICYDLRFPELFRSLADTCGIVVVLASWPATRQTHWDILLKARAVENQFYVAGVNRVGHGNGLDFTGGSVILDPLGETLAHAGDQEGIILADIDPAHPREVRDSLPFLRDRQAHIFKRAFNTPPVCKPLKEADSDGKQTDV
jgi:predicted amidohydrolase